MTGLSTIDSAPLKQAITSALEADRTDLPTAAGTRLRGSYAQACDRNIAYHILGTTPDHDPDGGALAAFHVGHSWHDVIQQGLVTLYGARLEVDVDLTPLGWEMSTHADAIYPDTSVEIKSKSEYAYKRYALGFKSTFAKEPTEPVGPDVPDIIQAGFSAIGAGCRFLHIIYVNKNKPSEVSEWRFRLDDPLPHLGGVSAREMAVADLERMTRILAQVDEGVLPGRDVPGFGRVNRVPAHNQVDPSEKRKPWRCRYCPFNETCAAAPAEPFSIAEAVA
jgi:hypothetical protein